MTQSRGITIGKIGPRTVVSVQEPITFQNREDLQATFRRCMEQQKTDIVLDATQVAFMDSEGLELLLDVHEELQEHGKALKLVGLNQTCSDIFTAAQLLAVFPVYENINRLIRSER
jgi:anti-sigma B factor antagonist